MPRNKIGGKKSKRSKNSTDNVEVIIPKKADFGQGEVEYAKITKMLGDGRVSLSMIERNNESRIGVIRGSLYKKVFMGVGDIVLVGIRDYDQKTCDIIHRYTQDGIHELLKSDELSDKQVNIGDLHHSASDDDDSEEDDDVAPQPNRNYEFNIDDI